MIRPCLESHALAARICHWVPGWLGRCHDRGTCFSGDAIARGYRDAGGVKSLMGIYDPQTVYSSIDTMGRYAFGNQPKIIHWNIARFAACLLPLINGDRNKAKEQVGPVIASFPDRFEQAYMKMMGKKLGLTSLEEEDQNLIILQRDLSNFKPKATDHGFKKVIIRGLSKFRPKDLYPFSFSLSVCRPRRNRGPLKGLRLKNLRPLLQRRWKSHDLPYCCCLKRTAG
jgi:hypothetical protein